MQVKEVAALAGDLEFFILEHKKALLIVLFCFGLVCIFFYYLQGIYNRTL